MLVNSVRKMQFGLAQKHITTNIFSSWAPPTQIIHFII